MKPSLRQSSLLVCLGVVLAACGGRSASQLPAAPGALPTNSAALAGPSADNAVMVQEASVGAPPAGFKMVVRADPHPGADGVIRGESPITVRFDLCGSTADGDKTLFFVYDWDFDHVADVVGSGAACEQQHTYRAKAVVNAAGDLEIHTNVCIVNGDPGIRNHSAFWACRQYSLALPIPAAPAAQTSGPVGSYLVESGPPWPSNPPTYTCLEACAVQFGGTPADYSCSTASNTIDHSAFVSTIYVGCSVASETYKNGATYLTPGDASAWVEDNCFAGQTNFCFR